jgi:glycosyltransferase involved in cell wall biosynthesis
MSKLSIITINYNNLEGLKRTVESVVNQTWQEFEYIVIDGDSTDGSAEYIRSQSDYIDYWVSESDKGIYNAMNKGIAKATGEYLLFLNSGDHLFDDNVLHESHQILIQKDLIYFNLNFVDKTNSWICKYKDKLLFSYLVKESLPHPATFIKATLFNKVGLYDEDLKIVSDWKFFLESICKFNSTYIRIDETLSTYYLDGFSSESKNRDLIFKERQQVLQSQFSAFLEDIQKLNNLKKIVENLKKSKKIKFLVQLGLLNKF